MSDDACKTALIHLWTYLDGQLDGAVDMATAAKIIQHMDACPECQECAEAEKKVRTMLQKSCNECAPVELRARITTLHIRW